MERRRYRPRPCFVAVAKAASLGKSEAGIKAPLGIALGTLIWCAASLIGVATLIEHFAWIANFIRFAGAAYLLYLGIKTFREAKMPFPVALNGKTTASSYFRVGFLTDIGNPKAAVFFSSLFAALLPQESPVLLKVSCVGVIILIEFTWYSLVTICFASASFSRAYKSFKTHIDRVSGGILVFFGLRLASSKI